MLSKIETLPEWLLDSADRNKGTLWQVVKAYRANLRQGTVGVKTRGMVSATSQKPYKQKRTGNARRGSFVSPICVGGGVAHGPKARDYRQAIPTKMADLALKIALAERIKAGRIFTGGLLIASGKTKDAATLIKDVTEKVGKTVICLGSVDETTLRAFRNIRGVELISPNSLNALDIVESRRLLIAPEALKAIETRLAD
jgi:large subunit ribosomal protein L4